MRRSRRVPLLVAAAVAAGAALLLVPGEASSLSPADVQGLYLVKLSGDAWIRTAGDTATPRREEGAVRGGAYLVLTAPAARNDGVVGVELRLDRDNEGSVLDRMTGTPDFVGEAVIVGERLAVIDTGSSVFVSALDLRFDKRGRKVSGSWLVAWPAATADAEFSGAAGVELKGKRFVERPNRPAPTLPSAKCEASPGPR